MYKFVGRNQKDDPIVCMAETVRELYHFTLTECRKEVYRMQQENCPEYPYACGRILNDSGEVIMFIFVGRAIQSVTRWSDNMAVEKIRIKWMEV